MKPGQASFDSFRCQKILKVGQHEYQIFSLREAERNGLAQVSKLPNSLKVLLENLLRHEDHVSVAREDLLAFGDWVKNKTSQREIAFYPARVVMQDFTGVPAIVDLAAMRDAMIAVGGDADKINPLIPVDLVIDHSVTVDYYGDEQAYKKNVDLEFSRNLERYQFLKWGQQAFKNFRVFPPSNGIVHQVNLEFLGKVAWVAKNGNESAVYFDTCVGTDSHTTMINGLSVLGWGVGGIEAESAMLGRPLTLILPEVVGFKLKGRLQEGANATDLVLAVTEILRHVGVVEKFVEFHGEGLDFLSLADRATLANMAPEYGATCGYFPVDQVLLDYLRLTGRSEEQVQLVEAYAKEQGVWRTNADDLVFTQVIELDLASVEPCIAGPKKPEERINLSQAAAKFHMDLVDVFQVKVEDRAMKVPVEGKSYTLTQGDICIAAITSCTNTSNPAAMIAAGLVAKKANEKGLKVRPWVKTSLAPGSRVVTDYLNQAGLQKHLNDLGFQLVGYGCTTCIGNSGPLLPAISNAIQSSGLVAASILSGNRNFEGRINPDTKASYLASPALVVAYALLGNIGLDLAESPLGVDQQGQPVYLRDLWPKNSEIQAVLQQCVRGKMYVENYEKIFKVREDDGKNQWQEISTAPNKVYAWDDQSTYIQSPPYFKNVKDAKANANTNADGTPAPTIASARVLVLLKDGVTTDHISPAGNIGKNSEAGRYLLKHQVAIENFNSYGSRRGNHEIMMRGTFANPRIRNLMMNGVEGGQTRSYPSGEITSIYAASMQYQRDGVNLVVIGGKNYGTGSSRDWAAKGTLLLGVKAVLAESFERIHRSNLVGMGVLPLEFVAGTNQATLGIKGDELFTIHGMDHLEIRCQVKVEMQRASGEVVSFTMLCRIDTLDELACFANGGILKLALKDLSHP
jgi:aconitate hydratase